ncbi:cell agglutination protein Mam3, partial [Cryomyces antarcticus]
MRPAVLSLVKLLFLALANLPFIRAAPLGSSLVSVLEEASPKDPKDPQLWIYLGVAMALVLGGGAFAGLTIALMGQDEIYLQVIATSGEGAERRHAKKVLRLLKKGKHWVLVTLLLSNVITNETLPIVLDRSLGGGWPAVLSSTILIVIFGEIAPQSVCVRYGLPIGAFMSPFVLALMWIMAPV